MELMELIKKAARKCTPPSEYQLSKRLGVTQAAVSVWKHGKGQPRLKHYLELLRISQEKRGKGTATIGSTIALALTTGALLVAGGTYAPIIKAARDLSIHYTKYTKGRKANRRPQVMSYA